MATLIAQLVKNPPAMCETWVQSLGWKIPWRRERLPTPVFWSGEFHGLYSPWGCKVLDTTEWLSIFYLNKVEIIERLSQYKKIKRKVEFNKWKTKGWKKESQQLIIWSCWKKVKVAQSYAYNSPWNSPGQNTGVGSFPWVNRGIEPRSSALQMDSLPAEPQGKPKNTGVGSLSLLQRIFWTLLSINKINKLLASLIKRKGSEPRSLILGIKKSGY